MKKIYHGSCHCGAVQFEAAIELSGETSKCNCSVCTKSRFWKTIVDATDFSLLQILNIAQREGKRTYNITAKTDNLGRGFEIAERVSGHARNLRS